MKSAIIPGFGIVADFGLSGTNCLLVHVSTITTQKPTRNFSDWLFEFCRKLLIETVLISLRSAFLFSNHVRIVNKVGVKPDY